ncbi:MAG: bile acid:sodium symporter family protein [Endomicrobiales bacterium]|nr:bile acid:sodium symporter family protein [Endomicrobiales bacterium]
MMLNALNAVFRYFTKLMVLWVLVAGLVAYFLPEVLIVFKPHIEWLFALTMVGIGAVLNFEDFKPVIMKPQLVLLGSLAQFAIMPALGFAIAKALRLPPELALGLIIVGATPGAMASNVISYLAKADVAYSVALTSTSTFLAPVLTPLLTYLYGRTYLDIPFWPMFFSIIKMVILPLIAGFAIKHYFRKYVEQYIEFFPAFSAFFIALICGLVVALNRDYILNVTFLIFIAIFLHNLFGMASGYGAGVMYGFDRKRRRTLSFEVGMQNAGLGAVLALKHFSSQTALPNALFAVWCIVTASVLARIWSKSSEP